MRLINKYIHESFSLAVDPVIFERTAARGIILDNEDILMIYTNRYNDYSFPGGGVDDGEDIKEGLIRELKEETNITGIAISQIGAFAAPGRDPRGWTISVAFAGNYNNSAKPIAGDDAAKVAWWATSELPSLAFDHWEIIDVALSRLVN